MRILRSLVCVFVAFALVSLSSVVAHAQTTLTADWKDALDRLAAGKASERDKAVLFANNDSVNAAALNGEIPDASYQAAQRDFDKMNQKLAGEAASSHGAKFDVQTRTSEKFTPGTDSDYIMEVRSKEQVAKIQADYNDRVNSYLKDKGVDLNQDKWHNTLDTDFMADPDHVKDPAEFRKIAELNNDAYKSRYAAEYERLSRAGGDAKIGPQHVEGYLEEMEGFAGKKGDKIENMLKQPASTFNDPKKRAELFQAMAQEQKYNSRIEALDDFLRKQEGLPPRNRGLTVSKAGSDRSPHNVQNIRDARKVSPSSRANAMEDLAETLGQVSKKNPKFSANAADDIAKIIERLPADRRAGVLQRLRLNGSPGLVDDVLAASARANRLPAGTSSLADDWARAQAKAGSKLDDAARAAGRNLDDVPTSGMRGALGGKAVALMEGLGRLGAGYDAYHAASQLDEYFAAINKARDPNTSDEEAAAEFARAQRLANALAEAGITGAIAEAYPPAAAAMGVWLLTRHGGEWVLANTETGQKINRATTEYLGRHVRAGNRLIDWLTGADKIEPANRQAVCDKFKQAVRENRLKAKGSFKPSEVCAAIMRGESVADIVEPGSAATNTEENISEPEVVLAPATCTAGENQTIIDQLGAAANGGNAKAAAHIAKLRTVNAALSAVDGKLKEATQNYASGELTATRSALESAKSQLAALGGAPACPDLSSRIAANLFKVDRFENALSAMDDAIESCASGAISGAISTFSEINHPAMQAKLKHANTVMSANGLYEQARNSFSGGDLKAAEAKLVEVRNKLDSVQSAQCTPLREKINAGLAKIEKIENAIAQAKVAAANCNSVDISRWQTKLDASENPAFADAKSLLKIANEKCGEQKAEAEQAARQSCTADAKARGGVFNYVEMKEDGSSTCHWCKGGYYPKRRNCIPTQKTADKWCNDNNSGSYWNAVNIKNDGTFQCKADTDKLNATATAFCKKDARKRGKIHARVEFKSDGSYNCYNCNRGYRPSGAACIPTQRTANSWCNANNAGSGWRARNIRRDGTFDCRQTGRAARRTAIANCRRQYGQRYLRVERQNGQYVCRFCYPGTRPSRGNCVAVANQNNPPSRITPPTGDVPCHPGLANYGKCWGNPLPQKKYKCMRRSGWGPFGC